jgi:two-component system cell cycle sensor histidine kinase PleC
MQSSEASGADANGFGVSNGQQSRRLRQAGQTASGPFRLVAFSPATLAVAITAFAAAALFVAYDTVTTLGQQPSIQASSILTSPVGASLAGMIEQRTTPEAAAAGALAGRAAAAFALAGLFTAFTLRRRRRESAIDPVTLENYSHLASTIPMGMACWTDDGEMVVCNDHYRSRLRLDNRQLTYHQALSRLVTGGYMKIIREDDNHRLFEIHQVDGCCLKVEERPLPKGGFTTLISDVTEYKQADLLLKTIREEQRQLARRYHEEKVKAEAASLAKTNFLAHLSHDIRTPLNHIIGFAELMEHETYGPLGDARYRDYIQSMKSSGEHLLTSFGAILDLAELENGRKVLRTDVVPMDEVMDAVCRRFRGEINRAGLTLAVNSNCGAMLRGDRLAIERMISNIVENSIRFTPAGGRLTLASFAADDGVVIEITDTGIGMNSDRLSSLSQPFALGDATFTRDGVGPGLGISISRAIAELSGGWMVIDSTPSVGTTVAISLPLDPSMAGIVAAE